MKKSAIICMLLVTIVAVPFLAKAQQPVTITLKYNVSTPVGNFKDVVSNTSPRGFGADILYHINQKFAVGLGVGYQDFYQQYPRQVYKTADGSDISAVVSYSIQTMPVLVTGHYSFLPGKIVQPYVGVGVGGNFIVYEQYLGEFSQSKTKFNFAAKPEVGLFVPFRRNGQTGVSVNAAYNYMPFDYNGTDRLDNWSAGIGIKFPIQ